MKNTSLGSLIRQFRVDSPFKPVIEVRVIARTDTEARKAAKVKKPSLARFLNLRAIPV